jgi:AcrR family transcriptional regulator
MPNRKTPEAGRKSAYVARNRAAILNATLVVLAERGKDATVEEVAEQAEIALSTVYKHFKNKEELIIETILDSFQKWEANAELKAKDIKDPLERFIYPMRLWMRLGETHPHHAKTLVNYYDVVAKIAMLLQAKIVNNIEELSQAKLITVEDPLIAGRNIYAVMTNTLYIQTTHPKSPANVGDNAIRVALSMLGISEAKAKKLTESKITL